MLSFALWFVCLVACRATVIVSNHTFVILDGEDLTLPCVEDKLLNIAWVNIPSLRWRLVENSLFIPRVTMEESGVYLCKGSSGRAIHHTVLVLSLPRTLWLSRTLLLPPPARQLALHQRFPCPPARAMDTWRKVVEIAACQKHAQDCLLVVSVTCADDQEMAGQVSVSLRLPVPELSRRSVLAAVSRCGNYTCIRNMRPRDVTAMADLLQSAVPRATSATSRFLSAASGVGLSLRDGHLEQQSTEGQCRPGSYLSNILCLPCRPNTFTRSPDPDTGASPRQCKPCPPTYTQPNFAAFDCTHTPHDFIDTNIRPAREARYNSDMRPGVNVRILHNPAMDMNDDGRIYQGDHHGGAGVMEETNLYTSVAVSLLSVWFIMLMLIWVVFCCSTCVCFPY